MIANHKGEIPFVILIIPFLLGLVTGLNLLSAAWIIPLSAAIVIPGIIFILLSFFYLRLNLYKIRWVGGLFINLLLFLLGCLCMLQYNELNRNNHFSKFPAKYLVTEVVSEPIAKNGYIRFKSVAIRAIGSNKTYTVSGNLLVSIKDSLAQAIKYGDELLIPANYKPVDPPFNPAEFNYKRYLAGQNIHYQLFLFHGQYVVMGHNTANPVIAYALQQRQKLVAKLRGNMHNPQAVAVASTLILGYRADLSEDVLQAYSETGTVYVLTVSGAQIAVIYFLLSWLLSFLNHRRFWKLSGSVIIICILWYYALLTGFSVSVCRAVLMVSFVIIGRNFNRHINSLNLLVASAFILLLYDPFYLTDVGFQLACIAVAGLIIFRPMVYKWIKFRNKIANKLWELCSVSIAAQLVIFPLSAFYFHQFPVYFLASNLLVFIPAAIIMYAGLIYLLPPQIPVLSKALAYLMEQTILFTNKALSAMENFPASSIQRIWIDPAEYLLLYAVIISLLCYLYYKKPWLLKLMLICTLLLSISFGYKKISAITSNSITFLNLRKHSGIVMRSGNSAVVISDLKDTDKNYQYSIQPYLDSSQVKTVHVYNPGQVINCAFVFKKYNYVRFLSKSLLMFNKQAVNIIVPNKQLQTDYILLTNNPYDAINTLGKNYYCKMLVIDAGNSDHFIQTAEQRAKLLHTNFTLLKRNKSLIAISNQ